MSVRLAVLLVVFLVALVFYIYHRNPAGWTEAATEASAAARSVPGSSWFKVATDAMHAATSPPATSDVADSGLETNSPPAPTAGDAAPPAPAPKADVAAPPAPAPAAVNSGAAAVPIVPVLVPCPPPTNWATFATTPSPAESTNSAAAPSTAPISAPGSTSAETPFVPAKPWSPPDIMPQQPNWVWTTTDGQEYDDVVVNKIDPDTVSITHSRGVAHVAIATLPPEIQKRLNYDPAAAKAAKKEADREAEHPYYRLATLEDAKTAARALHWPLAWVCGSLASLDMANAVPGSEDEATQMAVNDLKTEAVVVFLDGQSDFNQVVPILHDQFYQMDDGPIPGGHHFYAPKIVFSDPDMTKTLGRVSYTQMKTSGDAAISGVLASIAEGTPAPTPSTNAPAP